MGLQVLYERFIARPASDVLAENVTLQYVTTLKAFTGQGPVLKHLEDHNKNVVKKKSEKIISAVEGLTSVAVVVETILEFVSSGGSYLPGVDSFILDRTATLPVTHFVHFDQDQRITQICLSWDQADLLKQVEVIGSRAKNWPVFAGVDQIKMITASQKSHDQVNPAGTLSPRGRTRGGDPRSASPSKKHIQDPHASLNLYEQQEEARQPTAPNAVSPRESHKPAPRDMSDLFAAGHEDYVGAGPGSPPKKVGRDNVVAPKGAGHKKFQPSRIFEDEDLPEKKERQIYKTNPARYNHFDIGDSFDDAFQYKPNKEKRAEDMPIRPKGGSSGFQHKSNWDFEGFNTPEKVKPKVLDHNVVHFDYAQPEKGQENVPIRPQSQARKDQESHFELNDNGTPVTRPVIHKPRKDAHNHFEFNDDPTPAPRRIIARTKAAAGIYNDPVFGDVEQEKPLASVSSNTAKSRKEFASSWDF